jgi:hypothetical protein
MPAGDDMGQWTGGCFWIVVKLVIALAVIIFIIATLIKVWL